MDQSVLQDPLPIEPLTRQVKATVAVPGSKSYTNRALPIAALAEGTSLLTNVLDSEDTTLMMRALSELGISVIHDTANRCATIRGSGGQLTFDKAQLFLGNSGTSMRFLSSLVTVGHGEITLDGVSRMRERPMGDLLAALRSMHVEVDAMSPNDCPPIRIRANGLTGGRVAIRGNTSSQFLSGLMMAAPLAPDAVIIEVEGTLVSQPYVDMTLATMEAFGAQFERDGYRRFSFPGRNQGNGYRAREYAIEPDASAASYFFAAAAITGGEITVTGLGTQSLQGDLAFVHVLERMGCEIQKSADSTTVRGGCLKGIDVDMADISDTVPTLAAVAVFASGPTTIRNVAHIRHKETDRIAAVTCELRKAGCIVDEFEDGMTIHPQPIQSTIFDTYNDHRMAMSLALLGLKCPGIAVRDPGCTAKTYPSYFADLSRLARS